ncbi:MULTISPECIES: flagellin [Paracoccus]|uniref:flagellin n=1 Tax=Paracoccus TaxID=265 RepID=UPI0008699CEE|nr:MULTISPECIES: flagellin [Paracoccus]ODT61118.1 MAG: hypothetical protein ABS73_02685 [Paracoccus sp. SCN 68-21]
MTLNSIGDQARAYALQVASNRIKTTLSTLTQEVASGQVADVGQRLEGNTRALNEIENRIRLTSQLRQNGSDAAIRLQAIQDVFASVRLSTTELGFALAVDPFGDAAVLGTRSAEVANAFESVIQRLNGTNSNRYLFSGEASDVVPLSSAAEMLDILQGITAPLTTAADVAQAVSDWFDAPEGGGGFLDTAYHGTLGPAQRISVGEGVAVPMETTGASTAVRDLLKGLAMAAVMDRGALAGNQVERRQLMTTAGLQMTTADSSMLSEMGRVGLAQQVVERAQVTGTSSLNALERARGEIRSADPFETAAALTEVQGQLEALYAVTARLSKLKLVDYLR